MQAPFLDLSFYVGVPSVETALSSLRLSPPYAQQTAEKSAVGLSDLPSEVHSAGGSIVIRMEGEAFCGSMRDDTARLRRLGETVYVAFLSAAEKVECMYGAILIEYTLEEPLELRQDPRSLAFQNFYLSRRWLPSALVSDVISMAPPGIYIEERTRGIYVSASQEFNPAGVDLERSVAQEFSTRVGREIGRAIV